jgi:hypothetical protein
MSAVQQACKWYEGGMPRCHSGEEISPVDGVEGVHPVVGEHHCAVWVIAEGGVDGLADVLGPAWGSDQASTVGFFSGGISDEEKLFPSGCTDG